jgi:hypothetical protein
MPSRSHQVLYQALDELKGQNFSSFQDIMSHVLFSKTRASIAEMRKGLYSSPVSEGLGLEDDLADYAIDALVHELDLDSDVESKIG